MQIEGIDFVLEKNLPNKGELQPLIDILKSRQKQKQKEDKNITPKEREDIDV